MVRLETEVLPARRLLARHARLCTASVEESRKTRVVVAVSPAIDPKSSTSIFNDLEELKRRLVILLFLILLLFQMQTFSNGMRSG